MCPQVPALSTTKSRGPLCGAFLPFVNVVVDNAIDADPSTTLPPEPHSFARCPTLSQLKHLPLNDAGRSRSAFPPPPPTDWSPVVVMAVSGLTPVLFRVA